jgi:hypothetical protein
LFSFSTKFLASTSGFFAIQMIAFTPNSGLSVKQILNRGGYNFHCQRIVAVAIAQMLLLGINHGNYT